MNPAICISHRYTVFCLSQICGNFETKAGGDPTVPKSNSSDSRYRAESVENRNSFRNHLSLAHDCNVYRLTAICIDGLH
jgi:hypothetical protein